MLYLTRRRWEPMAAGGPSGPECMPEVVEFEIKGQNMLLGLEAYKDFLTEPWEWKRILASWSTDIPEKLPVTRRFWMNE